MTRKQAIEIITPVMTPREVVDVLDRAGAFPSEEVEAEIAYVARTILVNERVPYVTGSPLDSEWRNVALRLASACRKAGLVKP